MLAGKKLSFIVVSGVLLAGLFTFSGCAENHQPENRSPDKEEIASKRIASELQEQWDELTKDVEVNLNPGDFNENKRLNLNMAPDNKKIAFLWEGGFGMAGHPSHTVSGYYLVEEDEVIFASLVSGEVGAGAKPLWSPNGQHVAYKVSGPGSGDYAIIVEDVGDSGFVIGKDSVLNNNDQKVIDFDEEYWFKDLEWSGNGGKLYFTKYTPPVHLQEGEEIEEERCTLDVNKGEVLSRNNDK